MTRRIDLGRRRNKRDGATGNISGISRLDARLADWFTCRIGQTVEVEILDNPSRNRIEFIFDVNLLNISYSYSLSRRQFLSTQNQNVFKSLPLESIRNILQDRISSAVLRSEQQLTPDRRCCFNCCYCTRTTNRCSKGRGEVAYGYLCDDFISLYDPVRQGRSEEERQRQADLIRREAQEAIRQMNDYRARANSFAEQFAIAPDQIGDVGTVAPAESQQDLTFEQVQNSLADEAVRAFAVAARQAMESVEFGFRPEDVIRPQNHRQSELESRIAELEKQLKQQSAGNRGLDDGTRIHRRMVSMRDEDEDE